ncbi:MAG: DUF4450 domain-containing protein [Odoribacteraceae bacterium]|jgi:hypothetical protein|nr:DUF4450 domain-containing protein [Odoribacteraceae bacterium]
MKLALLLLLSVALHACDGPLAGSSPDGHRGNVQTLRYRPDGEDFVIENGKIKFNRALYGTQSAFRVEAGDLPEFAFYLPGMGGNCQIAITDGKRTLWLDEAARVVARYRPGSMIYEIRDPLLGKGEVTLTVHALAGEEGMIARADFRDTPAGLQWIVLYGGASNEKFSRSGDLNVDPPDAFALKPERCKNNHYLLLPAGFLLLHGTDTLTPDGASAVLERWKNGGGPLDGDEHPFRAWSGTFPEGSGMALAEATTYKQDGKTSARPALPVVTARGAIKNDTPLYFTLYRPRRGFISPADLPSLQLQAERARAALAGRVVIHTPDPYLNTLGGVISTVSDAIYEYPSYLHGAISWRSRLNGWRGAYVADALGWHDRARAHFSSYALSQLTAPATGPVTADTALHLTRALEKLGTAMFSSGYICRDPGGRFRPHHYDMNLVFIDQLLNHLAWTGDLEFLEKMWPTLERHLAWEKRLFDPDDDGLYDAYACIWASDGLMYNGGGVTHSSAYNYKANATAAALAGKIGRHPAPYRREAEKIKNAIERELWLAADGWWAEYVDRLGQRRVHPAAALWTIYHAIDSRLPDPYQAYQALRYIDEQIPHIPLDPVGLERGEYYLLSTTNWMPYTWSVNNVAFAEVMHAALAYWQGGRPGVAFTLLKSTLLDAMYCGSSPGNIGQISFHDAARGETYRDFADPTGTLARAVTEGLFGILPDLMNRRLALRPGFPPGWDHAAIHLPYLDFAYARQGSTTAYTFSPRLALPVEITLEIPAHAERVDTLTVNGQPASYRVNPDAIGHPSLLLDLPPGEKYHVNIAWGGAPFRDTTCSIIAAINELNVTDLGDIITGIRDPQGLIEEQEISDSHLQTRLCGTPGEKTFFARLQRGEMCWWQPVHVHLGKSVEILPAANESARSLDFRVRNNSERPLKGRLVINPRGNAREMELRVPPKTTSGIIRVPARHAVKGTNIVQVIFSGKRHEAPVVNWELPLLPSTVVPVEMRSCFNDRVTRIFEEGKYLSPRSPYTTLQLPAQGIGEWCHPHLTARIDDSGLRGQAIDDLFTTPFGLPFITPREEELNVAFVSLWDNYPGCLRVPLSGNASRAYFLMAGSTHHMQSQFENGTIAVRYKDGAADTLSLRNPETWAPIERDYFTNGLAFSLRQPRPYRVVLKSGLVARDLEPVITGKGLDQRYIDGGAAIILDLPLDPARELDYLEVAATANDVVIGLMAVTLAR